MPVAVVVGFVALYLIAWVTCAVQAAGLVVGARLLGRPVLAVEIGSASKGRTVTFGRLRVRLRLAPHGFAITYEPRYMLERADDRGQFKEPPLSLALLRLCSVLAGLLLAAACCALALLAGPTNGWAAVALFIAAVIVVVSLLNLLPGPSGVRERSAWGRTDLERAASAAAALDVLRDIPRSEDGGLDEAELRAGLGSQPDGSVGSAILQAALFSVVIDRPGAEDLVEAEALGKAALLSPDVPDALRRDVANLLAWEMATRGLPLDSSRLYLAEKAARLACDLSDGSAASVDTLALVLVRAGQFPEALDLARSVSEGAEREQLSDEQRASVACVHALAATGCGRGDEASEQLGVARTLDPTSQLLSAAVEAFENLDDPPPR